ncbi:hypothetical protein D3C73_1504530 [compost metagenome]
MGSAAIMVLLSIVNTMRHLGPDNDDIIDPAADTKPNTGARKKIGVLVTNWLFPIFALAMFGLALALS